ncbi:MAG: hypothetical protein JWM98_401, partial [Thermoleophilia bacterium]|nr:hypothetical protein [Thermoleophilia bacterium]
MSLVDGISGALGNRTTIGGTDQRRTLGTGSTPGSPTAAQGVANRFGTVFQTSFSSNMATVFEKGAHGDFDDPTLALQEQAALARLRAAQASAGTPATPSTGVPGAGTGGERGPGAGASAAPDAGAASTTTPVATTGSTPATAAPGATPPTSGTATTSAGDPAATAASGGSAEVVAQQRELYGVRVRQSAAQI